MLGQGRLRDVEERLEIADTGPAAVLAQHIDDLQARRITERLGELREPPGVDRLDVRPARCAAGLPDTPGAQRLELQDGRQVTGTVYGVDTLTDLAIVKIEAGATLLQLYTALVFEGPGLVARIKRDLVRYAEQEKLAHIGEASGRRAEDWAARPLEP